MAQKEDSEQDNQELIEEMMENLDKTKGKARVACPFPDCNYRGHPESVGSHIRAITDGSHNWKHSKYEGYQDYRKRHELL